MTTDVTRLTLDVVEALLGRDPVAVARARDRAAHASETTMMEPRGKPLVAEQPIRGAGCGRDSGAMRDMRAAC